MDLGIQGKTAIVTGGSRGFGKAVCTVLAMEGANVILNYRSNREQVEAMISKMNETSQGRIVGVQGDIGEESVQEALFMTATSQFGGADILVNNAATWTTGMVADLSKEEFEGVLSMNLVVPFLMCQKMVRHLKERGLGGHILNVVSKAGLEGSQRNHSHYASSKAGLIGFTKSLAREMAGKGINVNAIAPGYMKTDMMMDSIKNEEDMKRQNAKVPVGRMADPLEVANAAVFLVSERASYFTGITFDATGGMIMH